MRHGSHLLSSSALWFLKWICFISCVPIVWGNPQTLFRDPSHCWEADTPAHTGTWALWGCCWHHRPFPTFSEPLDWQYPSNRERKVDAGMSLCFTVSELIVSCCVFPGGNKMFPLTPWRELITLKASLMSHLIFSSFWKDVRGRQRYYNENKWSESRHGSLEEKKSTEAIDTKRSRPSSQASSHSAHTHKVLGGVRDLLKIQMSKNQKVKYLRPMWSNYSTKKVK